LAALTASPAAWAATTQTFSTAGQYSYVVPVGVTSIEVSASGAAGGTCGFPGGSAATESAMFAVNPGEVLSVQVGGQGASCNPVATVGGGFGGGGAGGVFAGGGGGASWVTFGVAPLVVAAGGGGASGYQPGGNAGAAGSDSEEGTGGGGATSSAGGTAGIDPVPLGAQFDGQAGSAWQGGAGGGTDPDANGGGGGGGGLYGGGGAGGGFNQGGSGGGGSSMIAQQATDTSGPTLTSTPAAVSITSAAPTASLNTTTLSFGSEPQGGVGAQQTVTVSNTGTAPLVVSATQTAGTNAGDYLIANECSAPVAPGASCQIGVRFAPQAQGASTASLTILTNAPTSLPPVELSGTGTATTIVCKDTLLAQVLCALEFPPGTFTVAGASKPRYAVERSGRTVASGVLVMRRGRSTRIHLPRLQRGRYTLVITARVGHQRQVLLHEQIQMQ